MTPNHDINVARCFCTIEEKSNKQKMLKFDGKIPIFALAKLVSKPNEYPKKIAKNFTVKIEI